MRCLVTGSGGFIGGYLVEHLLQRAAIVHAYDRVCGPVCERLQGDFHFHPGDITDPESVARCVRESRPDCIFHLAAQSFPRVSWDKPAATFQVNVLGSIHLFEAVRAADLHPRIVVVCSSAEYAVAREAAPIAEDAPLQPSSPYGVSKLAQDHLSRLYFERYGMDIMRVRPFFLIGPRKEGDVSSDFARGIVALERGAATRLAVGDLELVRDLLDVRDGVRAFWTVAEQGTPGSVYNVCSGTGYPLRDLLDLFRALARVEVREEVDPARLRRLDEKVRIGNPDSLKALGWRPLHPIRETLRDILDYWRGRVV